MKKAIAVLLILLAALLCVAPMSGCMKYTHIVISSQRLGDFYCSMYEDNTVEIIKYLGDDAIVHVPSGINGRSVVGITTRAFIDNDTVEEVYLPASISALPAKLFDNCTKLRAVYVPDDVTSIGKYFVTDCPEFTTVLYAGTEAQWNRISKGSVLTENYSLANAEIVYGYVVGD